jgi:hypothetical protein
MGSARLATGYPEALAPTVAPAVTDRDKTQPVTCRHCGLEPNELPDGPEEAPAANHPRTGPERAPGARRDDDRGQESHHCYEPEKARTHAVTLSLNALGALPDRRAVTP